MDTHLRSTSQVPAMCAVLGGRFAQQIICREGPYRSEREEEFLQISCDVKGKGGLERSLESYVQVGRLFVFCFCMMFWRKGDLVQLESSCLCVGGGVASIVCCALQLCLQLVGQQY